MKKYRIVQKLDKNNKFYYIVQQRRYLFFWGLPDWTVSYHINFIDTMDGLAAPPDYTYLRFTYDDLEELREKINRILKIKQEPDYSKPLEYF